MSPVVIARGVSLEFPNGRALFENISFSLDARPTALVGPNGVGKTCLAKLLAGEIEPTAGTIQRDRPISRFAQRLEPERITVAEFLIDNEWAGNEWSLSGERLLQGINRQAMCQTLSGGQWMRVRLARALGNEFLILDEPTNDLDRDGRDAVLHFLRDHQGGTLLISHDRECLELCEDILELSNRGLARFGGGWTAYTDAREQERERLHAALDLAKRERDAAIADRFKQREKQEKRNRRGAESGNRGGIPKIILGGRKRAAQVSTGRLDVATLERANIAVRQAHAALTELKLDPVMYAELAGSEIPAQKLVAEAHDFNITFSGGRDWLYPNDLNFSWRGNIRLALKGANGSGKSSLLKALLGHPFTTRGELRRGDLTATYVDQRCASLDDSKSILDNVRDVSPASESDIRTGLARFLFARETVFQPAAQLSGGERLRAALARAFLATTRPELLILDEPTNNLDLANIEFLEALVSAYRGALIVISHDERFLENCGIQRSFSMLRSQGQFRPRSNGPLE